MPLVPGIDTTADLAPPTGALGLVILDERGRRFVPLRSRLVLGRADDCDVVLPDPLVSRRHAMILATDPPTVVDAGSKLGTRVDGQVLTAGQRAPLREGAALWLGATCITLGHAPSAADIPRAVAAPPGYVVASPRMRGLLEIATLAGPSRLAVVIHGESGSGKELVAEAIHGASGRSGELVRVNCAAIAESVADSELFGHERGAFTGATHARVGLIEAADGGTLFLDEVAELPMPLQAKLLRALERGEVTRVGASSPRLVDLRVVAASHRLLADEVRRGRFREDLLFRLAGIQLTVPPLRERGEDIVPLARHFLSSSRPGRPPPSLTASAERWLVGQPWPGNVRELRAAVLRAVVFAAAAPAIDLEHFTIGHPGMPVVGDDDERARIQRALDSAAHNQTRAAQLLGISRRTLVRRLGELGFTRPRKGP